MGQLTVDQIKTVVLPILKDAGVTRSSLFGSYARGEALETSDIDLLVEYPSNANLFTMGELKENLQDALGKPVDLVQFSKIKPRLQEQILAQQMIIL